VVFLAMLVAGCSGDAAPRDQWTVVVSTDAPLPQFGDRLLFEVVDSSGSPACSNCRREFATPKSWPVSFGIVPSGSEPARVRARLYRSAYAGTDGLPLGPAVIDAVGILPRAAGDTPVGVDLVLGCFGTPADAAAGTACDPVTGQPGPQHLLDSPPGAPLVPGTSPLAVTKPCRGAAPSGMVCVDGGAFILGAPRFAALLGSYDPAPEHLVVLDPFALDVDEFTVGALRQLIRDGKVTGPLRARGQAVNDEYCTYLGADDGANDAKPVNCIPRDTAVEACAALSKRLPTEAEWEFAAGNRTEETTYPWGGDEDDFCDRTIVARGGVEQLDAQCLDSSGTVVGPVAGGAARDVTKLGIRNLAGNLCEWMPDAFAPYDSACWNAGVLHDPMCSAAQAGTIQQSIRGGSWGAAPISARVYTRNGNAGPGVDDSTGFRCAVSM